MANRGKIIDNPITGERMEFLQTSFDTDGGLLQVMLTVKPKGFVTAPHIHPFQEERIIVKSGTLRIKVGEDEQVLTAGEESIIPQRTPHVWWNDNSEELKALVEFRPALQTENFFSSLFALAKAGKTNKKGMPNLLQLAVMNRKYWYEIYLAKPSITVQKILFRSIEWIGRLLGYRSDYPCVSRKIELDMGVYEYDLATVPIENCD